ncbi:hypothetical protein FQN54_008012 [Arachnomyces sp. PD_36]|nr:hypothetical protein FQN54_008012 [Arachnomyces sp. PD_36]
MTSVQNSAFHPFADLETFVPSQRSYGLEKISSPTFAKVFIPDLFVSFVAQRPQPNPYYEEVKRESEEWMKGLCHWTERDYKKHIRADFPYFAAVWTTEAGRDEFRTIVDWCNWVFDFDDLFDDGELNEDPEKARNEVDALLTLMNGANLSLYSAEEHPLRYVFQSVWQRIVKRSSLGAQQRFIKSMEGFFSGLVGQVDVRFASSIPDIETYLALRRESIGVYPCLALVEYFHALDIPDEVFQSTPVREIECLAADIVLLQNDILSFHKEQSMGVNHNIVHLFRQTGISQQEAYDRVSELLNQRYRRWYIAHSELPLWGEKIDTQVQLYLKGCQDVILGNLNWSFKSERYFGKDNNTVLSVDFRYRAMSPQKPSHWRLVASHSYVTDDVLAHAYTGSGTADDPFLVEWTPDDPRNPMLFSTTRKWIITTVVSFAALAIAFASTAYSGSIAQVMDEFHCSTDVAGLGLSLFVLGFAIGPLLWAPLSEIYGRQSLFFLTYAIFTAFNAGAAGATNIQTLLVLRFFAGAFGSSPLTNSGGVIADTFPASQRSLAMCAFASAPFLGPTLGPIVGGFAGESIGWRWVQGIITIFSGVLWIAGTLFVPETYAPVLLKKRAQKLSEMTGQVYVSKVEHDRGKQTLGQVYRIALSRPWVLLIREPIVLLLSIYTAIVYGTLYLTFAAFPIVYQEGRGWSQGVGGLAFIGVAVGMLLGIIVTIYDNKRYNRAAENSGGAAPPEERLPPMMVGGIVLPVGLFIFAWTTFDNIHWIVSLIFTGALGFGNVMLFLSVSNYLIDTYTIFAASVLSANAVLRSLFGAVFPLFTPRMYENLGVHWASSVPAFLALACAPLPFLFYKYGAAIRERCKYSAEAAKIMAQLKRG